MHTNMQLHSLLHVHKCTVTVFDGEQQILQHLHNVNI